MFKFSLMGNLPWEDGTMPDATNDVVDVYIEEHLTQYLKYDRDDRPIRELKKWYVALVKFRDEQTSEWIISDGTGVLDATTNYEKICSMCDKWKLIEGGRI